MTFIVKLRGDVGAPLLADYRCADHGVFESLVARPAPDDVLCPTCGALSPWTPSPVTTHQPAFVSAHRGKDDEKPGPWAMDTELIADGKMTTAEWKKHRESMWRAHDADSDPDRPKKVYSR